MIVHEQAMFSGGRDCCGISRWRVAAAVACGKPADDTRIPAGCAAAVRSGHSGAMLSSPTTSRSQARTDVQVLPGASRSDAWSYVARRGPLPTQQPPTHDPAAGRVRSEFDIPTAPQLELTLDAARAPPVVLDLREHAVIDGCGTPSPCAGSRAR